MGIFRKRWRFDKDPPEGPLHVYPIKDLVDHELEGDDCICGVTSEPVERPDGSIGWVIMHHALDGRK